MYVGEPAIRPSEGLLESVREIARRYRAVLAAYAFNMLVEKEGKPTLVIGLVIDSAAMLANDSRVVMEAVMRQTQPWIESGKYVDFRRFDPSHPLLEAVARLVKPFYERTKAFPN